MPRLVAPTVPPGSLAGTEQPTLEIDVDRGARVRLRAWEPGDGGVLVSAFADPEIQRWHFRRLDSIAEADEWITATHAGWESEAAATWAIADRERDAVLGRVTLYFRDLRSGIAEVSYWVLPEARGRGVAGRAVAAVSEWALGPARFHRIELEHSLHNPASCRVAGKADFTAEGVRRSALRHADGWHDMHLHSRIAVPREQ